MLIITGRPYSGRHTMEAELLKQGFFHVDGSKAPSSMDDDLKYMFATAVVDIDAIKDYCETMEGYTVDIVYMNTSSREIREKACIAKMCNGNAGIDKKTAVERFNDEDLAVSKEAYDFESFVLKKALIFPTVQTTYHIINNDYEPRTLKNTAKTLRKLLITRYRLSLIVKQCMEKSGSVFVDVDSEITELCADDTVVSIVLASNCLGQGEMLSRLIHEWLSDPNAVLPDMPTGI